MREAAQGRQRGARGIINESGGGLKAGVELLSKGHSIKMHTAIR